MKIADEYFNRSRTIALNNPGLNKIVRYNVFCRKTGILSGSDKAVSFIKDNTYGPLLIRGGNDGYHFREGEVVLQIEGLFSELVNLETTYLGMLSFSGVATGMRNIVDVANGVPIIDMSPRHFPWQIIEDVAYAAFIGGAVGTSSQAGYDYVKKWRPEAHFDLYGSIPHALNAVCGGSSVEAARYYSTEFPDIRLTVLIDFEGKELDVCKAAFEEFGEDLYAVRLDTHGGRICQGCSDLGYAVLAMNRDNPYNCGTGVTIEAAKTVRKFLDEIGAKHVKLIVSSGFNMDKVEAFIDAEIPIDAIGTGSSWVKFFMFTSDIAAVYEDGKWQPRCKAGRKHGPLVTNRILFQRGEEV